ncbi:hypothetical protein BXZ70DRAFT_1055740 [Cristinia sonorae]|uniref:DUF6533 domain-containing protein n=1 Tax=Cristinia sonorae TaxID=1940300 RepID=A0A8K0UVG5_9AGAR|nr:hypothetical protein BXZ70DRAFT_1055740 [Cristinia sonorae]
MAGQMSNHEQSLTDAFVLSSIVLLAYDTLLTFPREWQCIWRRKFTSVTFLYVLQRYVALIAFVLRLPQTPGIGPRVGWFAKFEMGYADRLCKINFAFFVVFYMLMVLGVSLPTSTRSVTIIGDLMVIVYIWAKTVNAWSLEELSQLKPRLTTVLVRNGTLYCVALLVMNVVVLILNQSAATSSSAFIYTINAFSANLIARFFLDLQNVFQPPTVTTSTMGGMKFAVADNTSKVFAQGIPPPTFSDALAAPAEDSIWLTDAGEDALVYLDDTQVESSASASHAPVSSHVPGESSEPCHGVV